MAIQTFAGGGWWYAGHKIVYIDIVAQHIREASGLNDTVNVWQPTFATRMKIWKAAKEIKIKFKNRKYGK